MLSAPVLQNGLLLVDKQLARRRLDVGYMARFPPSITLAVCVHRLRVYFANFYCIVGFSTVCSGPVTRFAHQR